MVIAPETPTSHSPKRFVALDGWRGISILLVLAGHMLPLGPASWQINAEVAPLGMTIFFTLSGFLIVNMLQGETGPYAFLIKRFARIIPLAWLVLFLVLALNAAAPMQWVGNFLFFSNLPPFYLQFTGHFWSLGVEMQFYLAMGLLILLLGKRGLWLVPIAALTVTGIRIAAHEPLSIVTWYRVDEILAGGILAMLLRDIDRARSYLKTVPFIVIAALFVLSTRPELPFLNYMRPYLSAAMIGSTLVGSVAYLTPALHSKFLAYLAKISYALYVIHPYTMVGWLGAGHGFEKYAWRPICFALSFGLAHLSTFYYEKRFIDWGHRVTRGGWPDALLGRARPAPGLGDSRLPERP